MTNELDWYRDLYQHAPIASMALDASGVIREINLTGATLLGMERAELLGRPLRLHVLPRDRRKFLTHMLRCWREHQQVVTELEIEAAHGHTLPVQLISRRSVASKLGVNFGTTMFDLTERRRTELAQALEHKRLTLALSASCDGFYDYSWPSAELRGSPRWSQLVGHDGYPAGGAELWDWFHDHIDPADRRIVAAARERFAAGDDVALDIEYRLHRDDGRVVWLRETAQIAARGPHGRACRVVGVLHDISGERQQVDEAARQAALLRALSTSLFRVEENERRELAALLHDGPGQQLVAAKMQLEALAARGLEPTALRQVCTLLDEAHTSLRSVTFQLRPPILHDVGLTAALRWLARETETNHGIPITVAAVESLPRLVDDSEYVLFRCIRELLFNVVKHADARAIRLEVDDTDEALVLRVVDDGKGFDPDHVIARRMISHSFGLLSVHERITALGGSMHVDSEVGHGTRIELRVPIAAP